MGIFSKSGWNKKHLSCHHLVLGAPLVGPAAVLMPRLGSRSRSIFDPSRNHQQEKSHITWLKGNKHTQQNPMGRTVYLPTFAIRISQNVDKYTLHGLDEILDIWYIINLHLKKWNLRMFCQPSTRGMTSFEGTPVRFRLRNSAVIRYSWRFCCFGTWQFPVASVIFPNKNAITGTFGGQSPNHRATMGNCNRPREIIHGIILPVPLAGFTRKK